MNSARKGNMYFFILLVSMTIGSIIVQMFTIEAKYMVVATQFLFLLIPSIIIIKSTNRPISEVIRFRKIDFSDIVIIIIISVISLFLTGIINMISMKIFHNFLADAVNTWGTMNLFQWIFILAVTPAICEEVVMRGVVLSEYKHVSATKAALMNGLLFGVFHMNINQFLYAFVLGVIMAYMVIITKSILSSMLMHFTLNGISAVSNWYIRNSDLATVGEAQTAYDPTIVHLVILAIAAIGIIVAISFIMKWWAKRKNINLMRTEDVDEKIFDRWIVLSIAFFVALNIMTFYSLGKI